MRIARVRENSRVKIAGRPFEAKRNGGVASNAALAARPVMMPACASVWHGPTRARAGSAGRFDAA